MDFPQALARVYLHFADAAAEIIVGPGYEAYLPNKPVIGARRWAHFTVVTG